MKKATQRAILVIVLVFFSILVVLAAGATAVWPGSEVRAFGLVALPTAVVAVLLVVYFHWRATFRHRRLAGRYDHREAA